MLPFTSQVLLWQVVVTGAVTLLGFGLFGLLLQRQLSGEYEQRALAVARSVATSDELRALVAGYSADDRAGPGIAGELADGAVQRYAEAVRARTGALFVVVTDDRGIRLSHPQPDALGRMVSTDPSIPLAGAEEIVEQTGTLGPSARAKVPVFAPGTDPSAVVGAVSVGIAATEIAAAWGAELPGLAGFAVGALALGVVASVLLNRRLRRLTLGLEPEEMAALVSEHEAVLGGIAEGVFAVDGDGRITVANDEARRLLGPAVRPATSIAAAGLPDRLLELLGEQSRPAAPLPPDRTGSRPVVLVAGDRALVATLRPVTRRQRWLGTVVSVRDRTDVELLTRQLDAVQTMSTALRAQRHEFANRLHLLHGLIEAGRPEEAEDYIRSVLDAGPLGSMLPGLDCVADPSVQAFLSAKAAHFRERSVTLRLGPQTWLPERVGDPVAVTTVLGNLLDNACDAAAGGGAGRAWVEVELLRDRGPDAVTTLFLTVTDSGPGVSATVRDRLFDTGVSDKADDSGQGRGVGLAVVRQVARAAGGDVWLATPGDGEPASGATFVARLPQPGPAAGLRAFAQPVEGR
jgi:two-component system CitB family sensor kinase